MKTVTLTDEEVQELREILNSKISKYLDDFWKFLKTIKLFKKYLIFSKTSIIIIT